MTIAALAGMTPAKNNAIMTRVAATARITRTRLTATLGCDAVEPRVAGELPRWTSAMRAAVIDQPDRRDRRQRRANAGVRDMAKSRRS